MGLFLEKDRTIFKDAKEMKEEKATKNLYRDQTRSASYDRSVGQVDSQICAECGYTFALEMERDCHP